MGCCGSSDSDSEGKKNLHGGTVYLDSNALKDVPVKAGIAGSPNKKSNADNDDDENSDDGQNESDNASVSSRKSVVSVSSTRSSKALSHGQGSIPKSQDVLLALARSNQTKGHDPYVSPSARALDVKGMKTTMSGGAGRENSGPDGSANASSPTTEGSLEAARNEMSMFVFGDYTVDPLDAIEQRNARYGGGGKKGGGHNSNNNTPRKHLSSSLASTTGGVQFVLNDFVIKTMDEEMIDGADFRGTMTFKEEEFFGERALRNAKCKCILGHGARVKAIAVAPDEATFVSSSVEDNDILQQFVSGNGELFYFTGHGAAIVSLSFSRDGHYFASTSRDASIAVWDAQQGTVHKRVRWLDADCGGGGSIPIANAFSCNGQYICAGYQDRVCRVWDLDRNTVVTHFTEHEGIVICVSCHPHELICASGGADRMVFLWNLEGGNIVFRCSGHDNAVISVNFTPNGESLISSDDKSCKIWDVKTGTLKLTVNVNDIVTSMPTIGNTNRAPQVTMITQNSGDNNAINAVRTTSAVVKPSNEQSKNNSSSQSLGNTQRPTNTTTTTGGTGSTNNNDNNNNSSTSQNEKDQKNHSSTGNSGLQQETSLPGSTVPNSAASDGPNTFPHQQDGTPNSSTHHNNTNTDSQKKIATNNTSINNSSRHQSQSPVQPNGHNNINNNAASSANNNNNNNDELNNTSQGSLGQSSLSASPSMSGAPPGVPRLPPALWNALNGRNSLATAKKAFQSTAAISQRMAFTVSCPCPGSFSTGYFAVASTAKSVHIISMTTGREETSFAAKAPVFALACGRDEILMFGDTFGNLYVAQLK